MNKGSACVEATLVMPLFIVAMVSLYCMGKVRMAELVVYEAIAECSEYTAEMVYLNSTNICAPQLYLEQYIDDIEIVKKYIEGGVGGISFFGSYIDDKQNVHIKAKYTVRISLPFLPVLSKEKEIEISQRGYTGAFFEEEQSGEALEDVYVYVADNQEVYHTSRLCTYLKLSITNVSVDAAKERGYENCHLCGHDTGENVYVTEYGNRYHTSLNCSGLKRTVHRVKKGDVKGLNECSRCRQGLSQ